ncbi:MAG: tetratricopeptide repeat protein [Thermodesulfovibrionia bacterium]
MDAVTYPDTKVINFINQHMIPLQVQYDTRPMAENFNIKWTPTIVMLDINGKEHYRTVGFLSPEELIPSLFLGISKSYFDTDKFDNALVYLDNLLTEYPKSDFAPEAIYLQGVCRYKNTHDPKPLKEAYEQLKAKHPSNEWTKRAYPYRLI